MEIVNMKQSLSSHQLAQYGWFIFYKKKNSLLIADVRVSSVKKAGTRTKIAISL